MSSPQQGRAVEKEQVICWNCGKLLQTGYHFVCHVCGASYCYTHMPEKCQHQERRPLLTVGQIPPKA